MAAGVRIQHPTERNVMFTLVDQKRPYPEPFVCLVCSKTHLFKTYHLKLDDVGATIVSKEIAEKLKALPDNGGFQITNQVAKPPAQRVGFGVPMDLPPVITHPSLKEPN